MQEETKRERLTIRATTELLQAVERYRAWLERREMTPISTQHAMTKLVRAGLAEADKAMGR